MILEQVKTVFNQLNKDNLHLLEDIYTEDLEFRDPLHHLHSRKELTNYFAKSYKGILFSHFKFKEELVGDGQAVLFWKMQFRHKWLKRGELIELDGNSHLKFSEKVYYHRDYLDSNELVFENIPLLGRGLSKLKSLV